MTGSGYEEKFKEYFKLYPNRGYGPRFRRWATSRRNASNNSKGNGSAMRVSPVGFAFDSLEVVLAEAKRSAEVTHNSDGGIRGAQAVASTIFLARMGSSKTEMKKYIEQTFGYDLREPLDEIRQYYYRHHDATCKRSVPQAITAFLESNDYEDATRKAVSIGGDSDTIACMAGGIAQAFYKGVPKEIEEKARSIVDERLNGVVTEFMSKYCL